MCKTKNSVFFYAQKFSLKIVKEELEKQVYITENNLHPYYKKENFQSYACYEAWKNSTLNCLLKSMDNFSHVQTTFSATETKYNEKLKNYTDYYERILNQIFK